MYRYKDPSEEEHWGAQILGFNSFSGYNGMNVEQLIIPEKLRGCQVIGIGEKAFKGANGIRAVHLPEGLMEIHTEAFAECQELCEVHLPDSLLEIGKEAFKECSRLKEVSILEKVVSVGEGAFQECRELSAVHLPNAPLKIEKKAFYRCGQLEGISIPEKIVSVGDEAFAGSGIEWIRFPASLRMIPQGCCNGCVRLKKIILNEGIRWIRGMAFAGDYHYNKDEYIEENELPYVVIPKSVCDIEYGAFKYRSKTALAFLEENEEERYGYAAQFAEYKAPIYMLRGSAIEKAIDDWYWKTDYSKRRSDAYNNTHDLSEFPFPLDE